MRVLHASGPVVQWPGHAVSGPRKLSAETDGSSQPALRIFGSHVNFRTKNTFDYTVEGSSSVTATIRPVPPPSRLVPATVAINALGPAPPTVTVGP